MKVLLYRPSTAQAAIAKFLIVKFGDADATVVPAAGAGDALVGVNAELDVVAGERHDVAVVGITPVVAGAAFARGAALTSDAQGRAVLAAAGNRVVGFAHEAAMAAGDIVHMQLAPGVL